MAAQGGFKMCYDNYLRVEKEEKRKGHIKSTEGWRLVLIVRAAMVFKKFPRFSCFAEIGKT